MMVTLAIMWTLDRMGCVVECTLRLQVASAWYYKSATSCIIVLAYVYWTEIFLKCHLSHY